MRLRLLIAAVLPLTFTACLSGTEPTVIPIVPIEQTTFASTLNVNLAASTKTATGLYYRDITVGTGTTATGTSKASVYFDGYRTDGTRFQSLASPSLTYDVDLGLNPPKTIPGFVEGVIGMKVGGKRQLIVPPALAYGAAGAVDPVTGGVIILPNSVVVFTVELVSVQ